jgi:hypothetical protein
MFDPVWGRILKIHIDPYQPGIPPESISSKSYSDPPGGEGAWCEVEGKYDEMRIDFTLYPGYLCINL